MERKIRIIEKKIMRRVVKLLSWENKKDGVLCFNQQTLMYLFGSNFSTFCRGKIKVIKTSEKDNYLVDYDCVKKKIIKLEQDKSRIIKVLKDLKNILGGVSNET